MQLAKHIEPSELKTMTYLGPSMNPTLKSGDRLYITPYDKQKIRRGDVIVFLSPEDGAKVVHRVVTIDSYSIRTRGDNCNQVDPWILSSDHILGRVVCRKRRNKWRRVFGGPLGQLFVVTIRAIHTIDSSVSSLLRPAYDRLARTGIFRRLLADQMKTRVVSFNRPAGTELQLIMGRWVVGRWLPGRARWHIRRPFRLFVDEASLPENSAKGSVVCGPLARHSRFGDGGLSVANKDI